ncbi:MAG: hypothetical protein L0Z62_32300 [Gemmataceae bacterium]|nr:hypothetical protein [Gemmataceae bacterium]
MPVNQGTRWAPAGWLALLLALLGAAPLQAQDEAPEEPDFFFLTGGPYTQKKNSPQIIWANQWFRRDTVLLDSRDYTGAGRFEWGLTDRWEADFEFGALATRERVAGITTASESGPADLLVGVRYRLLREESAPFTLTTGPQVMAPVASRRKGLGTGEVGYAWDLAAAKDWGGPVFLVTSINLSLTPDVPAFPDGRGLRFDLSAINWGTAVGVRALERPAASGAHHDLHLLLELGGARGDSIDAGRRTRGTDLLFSSGVRYGFLNRSGHLFEIGLAVPVGITSSAPDWGLILQVQFELASLF